MNQVHKETLSAIENALPNRAGLDVEIFGMEGIPDEIVQQHNQRVLTQYHQAEAERRAATGNPAPGMQAAGASKKPKFESPSDLKKRLAEHKAAKLAAEQNGGGSDGSNTPVPTQVQTVAVQSPAPATSPAYPVYSQQYAAPPSTTTFSAPQTYNQPPAPAFQSVYTAGNAGFAQSPPPPQAFGQPMHAYHQQYSQPPQPFQPPFASPTTFSPSPLQGAIPMSGQGYQSQVPQNGFMGQVGLPRAYHSASPVSPFPAQQRTHSPAQNGLPQRIGTGSLPSAPGLPQRPAVSAPPVNAVQFQQMHQGQNPVTHNAAPPILGTQQSEGYNPTKPQIGMPTGLSGEADGASSLDDLISSASKQADEVAARAKTVTPNPALVQPAAPSKDESSETKAAKKDKESKEKATKPSRLVYSDNEISPEEKMAALDRYRFTPARQSIQV